MKKKKSNFVGQCNPVICLKELNVSDNTLRSQLGERTGDVCVAQNLHTDLYMQFSGVYIKAHISLSDCCFTGTIKPLFKCIAMS